MRPRDPQVEDWIERAKRTDIWWALMKLAPSNGVKRRGHKGAGPCPACGGKDRFSIDGSKGVYNCRKCGGGDVIRLVENVTGANFLGACEILTGESMPVPQPGAEIRREDPKLIEQRRLDAEAEAQRRQQEQNSYRDREIARGRDIWGEGEVFMGTIAEDYLRAARGVQPPAGARLRFHPTLKYWHMVQGKWKTLHTGPAMLARIDDNDHRFIGCHCTYLDLSRKNGKAQIADPDTGEVLDVKKVRGSQRGGHIHLGGSPASCTTLIMGEGIETTLSMREVMIGDGRNLDETLFWAGVNLGNIGGPSEGTVFHPDATRTDTRGRVRRKKVPGPVPDLSSIDRVLQPPPSIRRAVLLGDSDSDRFETEQHLWRAASRWKGRGVDTLIAWPDPGGDFNDMLREGMVA